jgi:diguanylate cyclase (GGDEF)-like protein/PAS domain S-box-containing protein
MDYNTLKRSLVEKDKLISFLSNELEETNRGVLQLTMELESDAEYKVRDRVVAIENLQQKLLDSVQGVMSLSFKLEQANEKYRNILECAREAIFTFGEDIHIESSNSAAVKLFGYNTEEMFNMSMEKLVPGFERLFSNFNSGCDNSELVKASPDNLDILGRKKSNRSFPIEMTIGTPFFNEKKTWMIIIRDITERKKIEQGYRLMAKVFENSNEAIMITDINGYIYQVNDSFTRITGYINHEVLSKSSTILHSDYHNGEFYNSISKSLIKTGRWSGEIWAKRKNGQVYPKWLSISAVKNTNGKVSHYVSLFTDITHRKDAETKLLQLAHFDQLTGLPNRTSFLDKLKWGIEFAARNKHFLALLFIDLDRFKVINDTLGHQAGDQLLIGVSKRLQSAVRKTDIVCRLAGDEFTIVLTELKDIKEIEVISNKIISTFAEPIRVENRELFVTSSIGISIYPSDGCDINQLLKSADTAMYHAKNKGKNTYSFYLDSMKQQVHEELELETNLRKAIQNNEFLLFYQPQMDLRSGKIVGMEALIRWKHPKLGYISPDRFIPFAEQSNLIVPLGRWVLQTACEQFVAWTKQGLPQIKISVNYSGVQLKQQDQVHLVSEILSETSMDPHFLGLELTESVAMENAESTIKTLHAFKQMGISISIDDFGTGFSSLSYLKRFPIDTLKIDRSFVKDIMTNSDDSAIASTIIAMAHQLRLSVIAEGIETKDQLFELKNKGCDQLQGYYFCPPIPHHDMKKFLLMHK